VEELRDTPTEFIGLYMAMAKDIEPKDLQEAAKLFHLVLSTNKPVFISYLFNAADGYSDGKVQEPFGKHFDGQRTKLAFGFARRTEQSSVGKARNLGV
jgi:hypothetical protein